MINFIHQAARDRIFEGFKEIEDEVTSGPVAFENPDPAKIIQTNCNSFVCDNSPKDDVNSSTAASTDANILYKVPSFNTPATLNPEAAPFSFNFSNPPEPIIEIPHIYTITPTSTSTQLSHDHFKEILAAHPIATIKTRSLPTLLAYLLLPHQNSKLTVSNEHWKITKWTPEFYLD